MTSERYLVIDTKDESYWLFYSFDDLVNSIKNEIISTCLCLKKQSVETFISEFCNRHEVYLLDKNKAENLYEKIKIVSIVSEIELRVSRNKAAKLESYMSAYLNLPEDEKKILRQKIQDIEGF